MPHDEVSKKYSVSRAQVKNLQESAGKFALMVAAFCECLGWNNLDLLISQFQVCVANHPLVVHLFSYFSSLPSPTIFDPDLPAPNHAPSQFFTLRFWFHYIFTIP